MLEKPLYDVEYADDILLLSIDNSADSVCLSSVENRSAECGVSFEPTKTELPVKEEPCEVTFSNGSPVPTATCIKYRGRIAWERPSEIA